MATKAFLEKAYLAYFGRPVDPTGLTDFAASTEAQVADAFAASAESKALYGSTFNYAQINAIYLALFNREAEKAGLEYWYAKVADKTYTAAGAAIAILNGAQNADKTAIENKLAASAAFSAALDTASEMIGYSGDAAAAAARSFLSSVTTTAATAAAVDAAVASTVAAKTAVPGQTFTLTAGVDAIPGTTVTLGNDTIAASDTTLTVLDEINGGAGTDTLKYVGTEDFDFSTGGVVGSVNSDAVTVTGVEALTLRSAGDLTFDASGFTGLTSATATQIVGDLDLTVGDDASATVSGITGDLDLTVGENGSATVSGVSGATVVTGSDTSNITINGTSGTTIDTIGGAAVVISNAKDDVTVAGGSTQTITISAGNVDASGASGAVTVTHSDQGVSTIDVLNGTSVVVASTADVSAVVAGAITVGDGTDDPSGDVTVTYNVSSDGAQADTGSDIEVNGGSSVTVTVNATNDDDSDTNALTLGDVDVNGGENTTTVAVNQTVSNTGTAVTTAVAAVLEVTTVTFVALADTDAVTIEGLTFTNDTGAALTAAQVAAAFANIATGATQGSSTVGTYSGTWSGDYSSGAVSTARVAFTAKAAAAGNNLGTGTTGNALTVANTTVGVAAVAAAAAVGAITSGDVNVLDNGDGVIESVTINGYDAVTVESDGLTTLSLANGSGAATVTSATADATLALTVNKLAATSQVDLSTAGDFTTVNITTTGSDSTTDLIAAATTALTVAGTKKLTLAADSDLTALETLVISGSASLVDDATDKYLAGANVTSVDASGTSGTVTGYIDSSAATYSGGSGVDTITLTSATMSKAISLGAGNDVLTLEDSAVGDPTAVLDGGTDTDTLSMAADSADAFSAGTTFKAQITGFEKLQLGTVDADANLALDLANMDDISYVKLGTLTANSGGLGDSTELAITNMAANGTLELAGANAADVLSVALKTDTTADKLNIVLGNATGGMVTANEIETIAITSSTANSTFDLDADSVTSISVTGSKALSLTTNSAVLTTVNASAATGALTYSASGDVAMTVTGGTAADELDASGSTKQDVLNGGAGNDTLTVGSGRATLTGGAGNDTFVIGLAAANVNSAATITDASAGDLIQFTDATSFASAAIDLDTTAVFQDYANAAIADIGSDGGMAWFQFGGNTYIVMETDDSTNDSIFVNAEDLVVKLTGLVDLSTASFNSNLGDGFIQIN